MALRDRYSQLGGDWPAFFFLLSGTLSHNGCMYIIRGMRFIAEVQRVYSLYVYICPAHSFSSTPEWLIISVRCSVFYARTIRVFGRKAKGAD